MNFTTSKLKNSQVEFIISLDKEDLVSFASEAEKKLAKQLKVEGFRLGKAPKEIVRKKIGEEIIREEALSLAVESSLAKVLAKENLDVVEKSDFKIKENSADKLIFEVRLLVFPEIKLGDYKEVVIKRNPVTINEAEVKNVLQDIINSRATLKEVERPTKLGDCVEIDFVIKDQGALIEGGKSQNHPVTLGENKFIPGFETQIVGMKIGEKKNFLLKAPVDYYQKTIAGKELEFEVVLRRVQEKKTPELNDDFVKSLGNLQSLEELEANIKQGLTLEKEAKEKDRLRLTVLKEIAGKTEVEIPILLIKRRLDSMIQGLDSELHKKGMELGLYLAHVKKTQDDLRREWQVKAEEQVKSSLIARAIAKKERLKVSEEEVAAQLQLVLQQYMMGSEAGSGSAGPEALQNINPEELKNKIHDTLLNEKVFELLEKNIKFT